MELAPLFLLTNSPVGIWQRLSFAEKMASFTGAPGLNLRYMGFCGVDDSVVNQELLHLLSLHYSWIEWGILFRPDLEGTPRSVSLVSYFFFSNFQANYALAHQSLCIISDMLLRNTSKGYASSIKRQAD